MKPRRTNQTSPSKRWSTTTSSALEETAHQMMNSDRGALVANRDRKAANTKTSISFGHEKLDYISDAMENQRKILAGQSAEERAAQAERIRSMKAELTTTNFCLGDEHPVYKSVNQESMAIAERFDRTGARAATNLTLKEAVKKSSINFGHEAPSYKSVAHESMEYRGSMNDFGKMKSEVETMKIELRKHNFSFGDESVDYTSDYQRGYGSLPLEAYRFAGDQKPFIRATIDDCRKAHFILGHDPVLYETNTARALKVEGTAGYAAEVAKNLERAKEMKAALQKTSLVIGDDAEYM